PRLLMRATYWPATAGAWWPCQSTSTIGPIVDDSITRRSRVSVIPGGAVIGRRWCEGTRVRNTLAARRRLPMDGVLRGALALRLRGPTTLDSRSRKRRVVRNH